MSVVVKPLTNKLSSKVITYKNFHYNIDEIPDVFKIITDAIDDDIEKIFIDLIDNPTDINKKKLKEISKCFAQQFETNLPFKLNTINFSKLQKGEGMAFSTEEKRVYNPCVVVISFGSDILFSLKDSKTNKVYNIPLPRKSMFLFQDPEYRYLRGIAKRDIDFIGSRKYERGDRYSIVFQSKKEGNF
jgi:hypothetical protein